MRPRYTTDKSASGASKPNKSTTVLTRPYDITQVAAVSRMRNATILIVTLRGVATETVKNIVLSGIGKLIVLDDALVQPEDLGAGFLFRDEDVGVKKRVHAAKPHIELLNPLVAVEVLDDQSLLEDEGRLVQLLETVDLVCVTEMDRAGAVSPPWPPSDEPNRSCRSVLTICHGA